MSYRLNIGILAAMLFGLCLVAVPCRAEGLAGSLKGEVTQNKPDLTFSVELELNGATGSFNYPSQGCGGRLDFLRSDGGAYWYRETLEFGNDKCVDRGTVELRPDPEEEKAWDWSWQGSRVTVRGIVRGTAEPESR